MISFSINIMRGCFGGCTFCSITEHEGASSRAVRTVDPARDREIRDKTKGFTGRFTDLGGPTANMYRLACKDPKIESSCRRLSCVYPGICENLQHRPFVADRAVPQGAPCRGKEDPVLARGVRYDLAVGNRRNTSRNW